MSCDAVRLDFRGFLTDGAIFFPIDNIPWVVAFLAVGSGGRYVKLEMTELSLVPTSVEGFAFISNEGHQAMSEAVRSGEDFDWQNYEWFDLTFNNVEVTAEEFTSVFGTGEQRNWLVFREVNEGNIMHEIFE